MLIIGAVSGFRSTALFATAQWGSETVGQGGREGLQRWATLVFYYCLFFSFVFKACLCPKFSIWIMFPRSQINRNHQRNGPRSLEQRKSAGRRVWFYVREGVATGSSSEGGKKRRQNTEERSFFNVSAYTNRRGRVSQDQRVFIHIASFVSALGLSFLKCLWPLGRVNKSIPPFNLVKLGEWNLQSERLAASTPTWFDLRCPTRYSLAGKLVEAWFDSWE